MGDKQSTPITPDGLRGLGFEYVTEGHYARCWRTLAPMGSNGKLTLVGFPHVWVASLTDLEQSWTLGDAPDLEWVAAMIDLLKRANGEG